MQIDQLFELVYVLIDKKQVTAKEMAERFGVSTRTIYRWVDALSVSGVPIYSQNGRGGGIAISEKYALDTKVLSDEERLAIVSSVKALNSLSGNPASVVNANIKAAEKISGLVEKDTDWLEVDFAPWSPEGSSVRQVFGTLRDCILQKKQVIFDYYSGDGRMERRTVHPWKLIYKGQAWYLQGWCTTRKAERFFKLTRMQNLDMTGRTANITHITTPQKIPQYKPKLLTIKAKVYPQKISYLLDTFICSEVIPHKDGSITVTFTVPEQDWIYELLLSFGPNMKIISPKQVKEKILQIAKDVQKIYKQ
ncbi:MAG: YafY family transcriptional regulator [Treponema sp.]|nr:YafY family transcriptional regulator [Treponema sp.]